MVPQKTQEYLSILLIMFSLVLFLNTSLIFLLDLKHDMTNLFSHLFHLLTIYSIIKYLWLLSLNKNLHSKVLSELYRFRILSQRFFSSVTIQCYY